MRGGLRYPTAPQQVRLQVLNLSMAVIRKRAKRVLALTANWGRCGLASTVPAGLREQRSGPPTLHASGASGTTGGRNKVRRTLGRTPSCCASPPSRRSVSVGRRLSEFWVRRQPNYGPRAILLTRSISRLESTLCGIISLYRLCRRCAGPVEVRTGTIGYVYGGVASAMGRRFCRLVGVRGSACSDSCDPRSGTRLSDLPHSIHP